MAVPSYSGGGAGVPRAYRIAPLAIGSVLWTKWQEHAGVLEATGLGRADAEYAAADELGLLVEDRAASDGNAPKSFPEGDLF